MANSNGSDKWQFVQLGEVCKLVNGRAFKPTDWRKTGLPIVRIQNLNDPTKPFNYYDGVVSDKHLIQDGDVLLSWSGTPGTSFGCFLWNRGKGVVNQHIFKVHVGMDTCDKEYFVFAMNNALEEMIAQAHGGVGLRHITKGKLERIKLPLPPIDEQRRIVSRIKECLSRVEEMKRLRDQATLESRALFPSLLASSFDEVLSTSEACLLEDLVVETRYGTSRSCSTEPVGIPILRIPNVAAGEINTDGLKYCELSDKEEKNILVQNGDLLVVRTNGSPALVGRSAVVPALKGKKFGFASYLIRIRIDRDRIDPRFLNYFLASSHGRRAIDKIKRTAAGQYNVNSENLRLIKIPLPSLTIQIELSNQMDRQKDVSKRLTQQQVLVRDEEAQIARSVLKKAFAGEL